MWTRTELKQDARKHLRGKYWMAFAVALISAMIGGGGQMGWSYKTDSSDFSKMDFSNLQGAIDGWSRQMEQFLSKPFAIFAVLFAILGVLFSILFAIFVSTVIEAGANRWFSRSREMEGSPSIGQMFSLFKSGSYLPTVAAQFWKNLFLFLWGLLPMILIFVSIVTAALAFVTNLLPDFDFNLPRSNFLYVGGAIVALVLGIMLGSVSSSSADSSM